MDESNHTLRDRLSEVLPPERVSVDREDLLWHSYDAWPMAVKWRQQGKRPYVPDVVVRVLHTEELSSLLQWAGTHDVPVTPWGAGSSVTGAPLPMRGGISLDLSGMNQVLALDEVNLMVKVQAGKMGHHLEEELNGRGYTLNHSPQSLDRSTVGGWVATRATGQFSTRWGGIEELALALTAVLPTGEIVQTRLAPRAAVGPDLRHIFLGAEGCMGVVTEVTLKMFPLPEARLFECVMFPELQPGLAAIRKIMRAGLRPFLVRLYDADETPHALRDANASGCACFLGCEGLPAVAEAELSACLEFCRAEGGELHGPDPVKAWMGRRFDFSLVESILEQPGGLAETIEVAHFWDTIYEVYVRLKERLEPLADEVLGHFSHTYPQGTSLYIILLGHAEDAARAEDRLARIWQVAMDTCLEMDAAISHHHGVGIARLPYIGQDLKSGMILLERIKAAVDPAGIMSPGKLGLT